MPYAELETHGLGSGSIESRGLGVLEWLQHPFANPKIEICKALKDHLLGLGRVGIARGCCSASRIVAHILWAYRAGSLGSEAQGPCMENLFYARRQEKEAIHHVQDLTLDLHE